jgi:hypothetical protein
LKNKVAIRIILIVFPLFVFIFIVTACGVYSFSGASTPARNIQVNQFYNNTDLAPANFAQTFSNRLKDYYQRNSSLKVVADNGELIIEGTISSYALTQIAPVIGADNVSTAAQSRLTIAVNIDYVDTLEPKNSFKSRSFSFYADFPNTQDLSSVQEELEKKILDQVLIDIFNATVANW